MNILAVDAGGTKTLVRLARLDGASRKTLAEEAFESKAWGSFDDLLADFLSRHLDARPKAACLAVAGPVHESTVQLTNLTWSIGAAELGVRFGIEQVRLLNDLHAAALAIPEIDPADLVVLQQGTVDLAAPRIVIGVGTGLGVAHIVRHEATNVFIPGEGGHALLSPFDAETGSFIAGFAPGGGWPSRETLISGPGLSKIHGKLAGTSMRGSEVTRLAKNGDPSAVRAVEILATLLGATAGDLAITTLASGGIFLTGGVVVGNGDLLRAPFIRAFNQKPPFEERMKSFPVYLVPGRTLVLDGAMAVATSLAAATPES
ncbi:MAG: glucokinase [Acidobacteria bacterium]|nr:glucokinase [Acidobacteriota bacterium]